MIQWDVFNIVLLLTFVVVDYFLWVVPYKFCFEWLVWRSVLVCNARKRWFGKKNTPSPWREFFRWVILVCIKEINRTNNKDINMRGMDVRNWAVRSLLQILNLWNWWNVVKEKWNLFKIDIKFTLKRVLSERFSWSWIW